MTKANEDFSHDTSPERQIESAPGARKSPVEKTTGFKHAYNAFLCICYRPNYLCGLILPKIMGAVFGGALFAFCVSRLPMLDIDGFYRSAGGIGEYFYIKQHKYKSKRSCSDPCLSTCWRKSLVGMIVHLIGILFANILAVFQFVPIIRHVRTVIVATST